MTQFSIQWILSLNRLSQKTVHVDETRVRIRGATGYVWVFTNSHEVVYLYSESREADILVKVMEGFQGVLVSDFYSAYDSVDCPQQKCLVHLLRDLNNEVLEHPYDEELKQLVQTFAVLLRPMIETIDRFGLKKRFLHKHVKTVDRFYRTLSTTEYGVHILRRTDSVCGAYGNPTATRRRAVWWRYNGSCDRSVRLGRR
jgi:hypothetical protein